MSTDSVPVSTLQLVAAANLDHQKLLTALDGVTVILFRGGLPFSGQNYSTFGLSK
jgi:hypothetical protein